MSYIKYFMCLAVLMAFTVHAQSVQNESQQEAEGDLRKEISQFRKQLKSKDREIVDLKKATEKLAEQLAEAKQTLQTERENADVKKLKWQIKELERDTADLAYRVRRESEDLDRKNRAQVEQYQNRHRADSVMIVRLQKKLDELQNFKRMWLAQLAESADEKWLGKTYSEIDVRELENEWKQCDEFASSDERVAEVRDKLEALLGECCLYAKGTNAVNSPYDGVAIGDLLPQVRILRGQVANPERKKELDGLYWQLNNYLETVEIFQAVIRAVDQNIDGQKNPSEAWPLVKATLQKQEKNGESISAIRMIPWLDKQYDLYYKELEGNCLQQNEVRDIILNLKP